jgi:hypothetical protein
MKDTYLEFESYAWRELSKVMAHLRLSVEARLEERGSATSSREACISTRSSRKVSDSDLALFQSVGVSGLAGVVVLIHWLLSNNEASKDLI